MAFFNYATMQMAAKIVYYGPGLCGKTTNLRYIYNKTSPKSRGEMVSLETETDRTLFFDLLPIEVGTVAGFKTRFQLYTVPGQVFYGETRRMVLKGVDGVVFVADSQIPMRDANIASLKDLKQNLEAMGLKLRDIPMVLQYNKRDLSNLLPVKTLEKTLNWYGKPSFESCALNGTGVFDTLKGISRLTLQSLKSKLAAPPEVITVKPIKKSRGGGVLHRGAAASKGTVSLPPPPKVEFATRKTVESDEKLASTAPKVKKVNTTEQRVSSELDRIRESLLAPLLISTRPKVKDLAPKLNRIKETALAGPKDRVVDLVLKVPGLPEKMTSDQSVRLNVSISLGGKKRAVRTSLALFGSDFERAGNGWAARLKLLLKKA